MSKPTPIRDLEPLTVYRIINVVTETPVRIGGINQWDTLEAAEAAQETLPPYATCEVRVYRMVEVPNDDVVIIITKAGVTITGNPEKAKQITSAVKDMFPKKYGDAVKREFYTRSRLSGFGNN